MTNYLIFIFLLLCYFSVNAQTDHENDEWVFYVRSLDNEADKLTEEQYKDQYNIKADTTHYYVVFESYFRETNVRVYSNDSLIYKDKITSNESVDLAKIVRVGSVESVKKISIGISDYLPLIVVYPMKGKYNYYLMVRPSPTFRPDIPPALIVRFSKYPQIRF